MTHIIGIAQNDSSQTIVRPWRQEGRRHASDPHFGFNRLQERRFNVIWKEHSLNLESGGKKYCILCETSFFHSYRRRSPLHHSAVLFGRWKPSSENIDKQRPPKQPWTIRKPIQKMGGYTVCECLARDLPWYLWYKATGDHCWLYTMTPHIWLDFRMVFGWFADPYFLVPVLSFWSQKCFVHSVWTENLCEQGISGLNTYFISTCKWFLTVGK